MRTIRKRLLALLLTVAMLGTLFAGLPIASAASEALGNVTDAAVDGNTLLLTIDSGGSASDLLTLEVCQDNILRVDYQPESVEPSPDTPIIDPELTWDTTTATEIDITGDPIVIQTDGMPYAMPHDGDAGRRNYAVLGTRERRHLPRRGALRTR